MLHKICKCCGQMKDIESFPKWKKTCKVCKSIYDKEWKENNKKIVKSICLDCGMDYETTIYSTERINSRCRKCSFLHTYKQKSILLKDKTCNSCGETKDLNFFYKNYKTCKPCLFKKRNNIYYKKLKSDKLFRIKHNIKTGLRRCLSENGYKKDNKKTTDILGCSLNEFREYIESKFELWMTWDNYGIYNGEFNYGWDIDHVIPISSAKTEEDIIKLYHFSNLQPLCSKINRDIKKNKKYESKTQDSI